MRLRASLIVAAFFLSVGPVLAEGTAQPRVAALPIYAAATAKGFGLFQPIALSPDGTHVAYTSCDKRRHAGAASQRAGKAYFGAAGCDIKMKSVRDGSEITIASGADNSFPAWSPDGHYLAFLSDRAGENQLYVWDASTRSTRRVLTAAMEPASIPLWTHDSKTILVILVPQVVQGSQHAASPDVLISGALIKGAGVTVYRSAENLTTSESSQAKNMTTASPLVSLDSFKGTLATVDVASGRAHVLMNDTPILVCSIAPNGHYGVCGKPVGFGADNGAALLSDVDVIDFSNDTIKTIAKRNPNASSSNWKIAFSWSPDSRFLAWRGSSRSPADISSYDLREDRVTVSNFGTASVGAIEPSDVAGSSDAGGIAWTGSSGKFLVVAVPGDWREPAFAFRPAANWIWEGSIQGGTMRKLLSIPGQHMDNVFTSASSDTALIQSTPLSDYGAAWYTLRLQNLAYAQVHHDQATLSNVTFSRDGGRIGYYKESASESPDIWVTPSNSISPTRVTHLNSFFDRYVLGKARLIDWRTADGQPLRGALMLPTDYIPGHRYPMVVYPYGSEYKSLQINNFGLGEEADNNEDLQILATRGIAVFLPDAPVHIGTPMWDIAKTIMPGVDRAIALGYADPSRLGVMGHSFGGYTVMSLITQTHRFRAAISRSGFSDWSSLYTELLPDGTAYGIRQAETFYGLGDGGPWKRLGRFISQSPYYRLNQVTTPLLIIHGSADSAVVAFNADISFVALRHLHKDVAYAKYADVDHIEGLWPFADQLDYMTRMVNWFDRYLCPARKSATEC